MWRCLRNPRFSRLSRTRLVTDGQKDRRIHDDGKYRASIASRGKKTLYEKQNTFHICATDGRNPEAVA